MLRCLIVDDSASFLEAAVSLLKREGMEVVGVASTGAEAEQQARELRPDLILVDILLGSEDGIAVARRLAASDGVGSVVLTSTLAESDVAAMTGSKDNFAFVPKSAFSAEAIRGLLSET